MNKKLLGLLLFAVMVVTNPIFAECKNIAQSCLFHTIFFPVSIGVNGQVYEDGEWRPKMVGDLIQEKYGPNKAGCVVIASIAGKLAIIGGAIAGTIVAVRYYKKKKQAAKEAEQPVQEIVSGSENPLIQNQDQEIATEEVA